MKPMDKKTNRILEITQILQQRNGASVKELAAGLDVSEMTIRRDLELLSQAGVVSLVHGAAIYNSESDLSALQQHYLVPQERAVHTSEKDRIGKAAAALVNPRDTIILDIGTTTEKVARYIPLRSEIAVLCFTVNTMVEVQKREVDKLLFGGGVFHPGTQLFESPETVALIRRTRANKLFLSAAGISDEFGLTCVNQYEVAIKQASIDSSLEKILLATSFKFGRIRSSHFADFDQLDVIITDNGLSEEWREIIQKKNIKLILV